jgi:hypothetical protein
MPEYNGGFQSYPDKVTKDIFFRAEGRATKTVTLLAGQVVKALTPLMSDNDGKYRVYTSALNESNLVTLNANLANLDVAIVAGLTSTASGVVTPAQWAAAILNYVNNGVAAGTNVTISGTLTGYSVDAYDADTLVFTSLTALTNVTDLAATGAQAAKLTFTKVDGATTLPRLAGVAVYDVAAINSAGGNADTEVAVYSKASFWSDAIRWAADPNADTIELPDGTLRACTSFNTGAAGIPATQADVKMLKRLRQKLVEGSDFDSLGFRNLGDYI